MCCRGCPHGNDPEECLECDCEHGNIRGECPTCTCAAHKKLRKNCTECCLPHGQIKSECKLCAELGSSDITKKDGNGAASKAVAGLAPGFDTQAAAGLAPGIPTDGVVVEMKPFSTTVVVDEAAMALEDPDFDDLDGDDI